MDFILEYHKWIEAFHVIAVVTWMAGMLYLPRLYVYHAGVTPGSESCTMLSVMERRLLMYIVNPSMIATLCLGISLALATDAYVFVWFHTKMVFVLLMLAIHASLAVYRRRFMLKQNTRSPIYFKILGETVTVLMVGAVIMAVVKPLR